MKNKKMKKNMVGLIAIVVIAAAVTFAGCLESGAPTSGRWIGNTSQGKDISFIVGDTKVYNFTISYDYSCTGGRGSATLKNNIPIDIVGNAFQDNSEMTYGEFTTSNSATGTFRKKWRELHRYEDCDSGNVTWSARRVQTMGD